MAKILIVDDDPDVVDVCRLILEKEGHLISSASSREEGMAIFEADPPDLLILDVMMRQPDDGIVMARDLRRGGVEIPILMLTGISKVTGMQFGKDQDLVPVDELLEKPVDAATLVAKVGELLDGKEV